MIQSLPLFQSDEYSPAGSSGIETLRVFGLYEYVPTKPSIALHL